MSLESPVNPKVLGTDHLVPLSLQDLCSNFYFLPVLTAEALKKNISDCRIHARLRFLKA